MKENPTVTLRNLAREAGVSVASVSYALRNDPRTSVAMRERIQQIAKRLGYHPNPVFSAMMVRNRNRHRNARATATGEVIAYLSGYPSAAQWRRSFPQPDLFAGAQARAAALNFRIEPFFYLERNWSEQRLQQVLLARGVRGVIVGGFPHRQEFHLDWSHFSPVTIGYTLQGPRLHCVSPDHFHNIHAALTAASRAGYRRVGCVIQRTLYRRIDQLWLAGLACAEHDEPAMESVPPLVLDPADWSADRVLAWHEKHRPEFVIARGPQVTSWLRAKLGRKAPVCTELSLRDRSESDGGIDEQNRKIGAAAVDLVMSQFQHNESGVPEHATLMLLPGAWRWLKPSLAKPGRGRRKTAAGN